MHTSNARRNNSECTPGPDIQCTSRRGLHCLAQRALDLPQKYRAPAFFLSLEFSPYTIVLVVIIWKKKKKERKRRERASTIYFTITASSDIRYCRHNTVTPIDLDRVPVSFREVIYTHTNVIYHVHTGAVCMCHRVVTTPDHQFSPATTVATTSYEVERPFEICRWPKEASRTAWLTSNPRFLSLNRKLRERHRLSNDSTTHGRPRPVFNR